MRGERRVVVDTSVIVSALLGDPEAAPSKVVRAMLSGAFRAYSSREAMEELYETLMSERVGERLGGRRELAALTYLLVNSSVTLVEPRRRITMCRDPGDDKFLEIAYEARAHYIVTLDKDLLDLRDDRREVELFGHKVKVLRPHEFLEELSYKAGLRSSKSLWRVNAHTSLTSRSGSGSLQ